MHNAIPLSGVALFFSLTGCSRYEFTECSSEEAEYIDAGMAWMQEHRSVIDADMKRIWSQEPQVTARALIDAIEDHRLVCGVGRSDDDVPATTRLGSGLIIIDVTDPWFREELDRYHKSRWVENYTYAELVDPTVVDFGEVNPVADMWEYVLSRANAGLLLNHEAAHILLGRHNAATRRQVQRDNFDPDVEDAAGLDEIYAWGLASVAAGDTVFDGIREEMLATLE